MAFAQGSRSSLSVGTQADFETTAVSFTGLPFKTHTLDLSKETLRGQDIRSDRMPRVNRQGNRNASGQIAVDLRKGNYDSLIESALLSSFATDDTIEVGTTPQFLTIEDALEDISQYRLFTGMAVNTMSVSIAPNQMVETTFDLVGRNATISGTGKTVTPETTEAPFDSYNGEIYEGGVGTSDLINIVSAINFSVTNAFAPTFVVGSDFTPQLEFGRSTIEGTLTVYAEDATLINKFLNETETSIQVSVDDPTGLNAYTFFFPRVKYNGASIPLQNEQSRFIELPFEALYDTSEGTQIRITRTS